MVTTKAPEVQKKAKKETIEDKKDGDTDSVVEEKKDPNLLTLEDIKQQVHLIEKSVQLKDARFSARVLRALTTTRKRLNDDVLIALVNGYYSYPAGATEKTKLLQYVSTIPSQTKMETDSKPLVFHPRSAKASTQPLLPEISTYISLLLLVYLIDAKDYDKAVSWASDITQRLSSLNRRSLDGLQAKCYYFYARAHELTGQLDTIRTYVYQASFLI